jgi:hypothetical protein
MSQITICGSDDDNTFHIQLNLAGMQKIKDEGGYLLLYKTSMRSRLTLAPDASATARKLHAEIGEESGILELEISARFIPLTNSTELRQNIEDASNDSVNVCGAPIDDLSETEDYSSETTAIFG